MKSYNKNDIEKESTKEITNKINVIQRKLEFLTKYVGGLNKLKLTLKRNKKEIENKVRLKQVLLENIKELKKLQQTSGKDWGVIEDGGISQPIPLVIANRENEVNLIDWEMEQRQNQLVLLEEEIRLGEEELELRKQTPEFRDIKEEDMQSYLG